MKRAIQLLLVLGVAVYCAAAWAQAWNLKYTCGQATIASSSTPVPFLPVAPMTTWCMSNPSGNTEVFVFPYPGTIPGSVPTNIMDIAPGQKYCDAVTCDNNTCKDAIGEAWGVVLATGSTSQVVYYCYR